MGKNLSKFKIPYSDVIESTTTINNGLAIDCILNNMYFIDSTNKKIQVLDLSNTSDYRTIINTTMDSSLKSLVVSPSKR